MRFRKNKKFIDPRYFMDEKTDAIKEELSSVLDEPGGTFTYNVIEEEDYGGPVVEIEGVSRTFEQMMQDMEGQELPNDDPAGPKTYTFTLEMYRRSEWEKLDDLFGNIILGGQAGDLIEAWAKRNGYEAQSSRSVPF